MTQQDDYYYEIQLTNKQLVFYFLAGALGLVLAFLVGVMVGRGVDNAGTETQAAKAVVEEKIVPEEPVASPSAEPSVEELTYARRLEADRAEETLERPRPVTSPAPAAKATPASRPTPTPRATSTPAAATPAPKPTATPGPPATPSPAPKPSATPAPKATPTPAPKATPTPSPKSTPAPATAKAGSFSIQVGAFSSRDAADAIVARLKKKGYDAFVVTPSEGLFNVRVGRYEARADAERIQAKLRDDEKFKPFIVRN